MEFNINNLIQNIDLSKFRVVKGIEVSKDRLVKYLSQGKCPVCERNLYQNFDGDRWFCKSKRKDRFFIRSEVLKKFYDFEE